MDKLKKALIITALFNTVFFSVNAKSAEPLDLADLYNQYEENNQSSLRMPQFNQSILISGIAVRSMQNPSGDILLIAGSENCDDELARLTPANQDEATKMASLKEGSAFKAECTLGMTSRSSYMALKECTLR